MVQSCGLGRQLGRHWDRSVVATRIVSGDTRKTLH